MTCGCLQARGGSNGGAAVGSDDPALRTPDTTPGSVRGRPPPASRWTPVSRASWAPPMPAGRVRSADGSPAGGREQGQTAVRLLPRTLDRRRDVLVAPKQVGGVVASLDRHQPVPGRPRVGLADPRRALLAEEVHVRAAVPLPQRRRELVDPG